jgi:hypothetical protein
MVGGVGIDEQGPFAGLVAVAGGEESVIKASARFIEATG